MLSLPVAALAWVAGSMTLDADEARRPSRIVRRDCGERVGPVDRGLGLVGLDGHLDDARAGLDVGADLHARLATSSFERGAGRVAVRARLQFDDDRGNR